MVALSVLPPRPSDRARGKALRRPVPATRVRDLAPARCALSANLALPPFPITNCAVRAWTGQPRRTVLSLTPCRCPALVANRRGWRRARAAALTRASGWQTVPEPCGRRRTRHAARRRDGSPSLCAGCLQCVDENRTKELRGRCERALPHGRRKRKRVGGPLVRNKGTARTANQLPASSGTERMERTPRRGAVVCPESRAPTHFARTERAAPHRRSSRAPMAADEHRAQGAHNTSARRQRHGEARHTGHRTPADLRRRTAPNSLPSHRQQRRESGQCDACAPQQPNRTRGKELIRRTAGNAWSERVPQSRRAAPSVALAHGCRTRTCGRHCVPNA
ncbi:hypothetical protein ERJ75_000691300 [Trypanosoma vivax]|nr:hypothetical protein ERJ75_000691300 [Trypanosoma vivax]